MHLRRNNDWVWRGDEGIFINSFADVSQRDFGDQGLITGSSSPSYISTKEDTQEPILPWEDNGTHSHRSDSSAGVLEYILQSLTHPRVDAQLNTYHGSSKYNTPKWEDSCLGMFCRGGQSRASYR